MLRFCLFTLLASGLVLSCLAQPQPPNPRPALPERVRAQRWQKRVLVLCAPTADMAALHQQKARLAAEQAQLQARDVLVLEAIETELSATEKQYLRRTLGVAAGSFAVVLLGKDGGVKRKENQPIAPQALFATIDAMPMRRQEMRAKKQ